MRVWFKPLLALTPMALTVYDVRGNYWFAFDMAMRLAYGESIQVIRTAQAAEDNSPATQQLPTLSAGLAGPYGKHLSWTNCNLALGNRATRNWGRIDISSTQRFQVFRVNTLKREWKMELKTTMLNGISQIQAL